jgi:hypothetical protein
MTKIRPRCAFRGQEGARLLLVAHVGGKDQDRQNQALRINEQGALAAVDFFPPS